MSAPELEGPAGGAQSLRDFSQLSGAITEPPPEGERHRVRYRNLHHGQRKRQWAKSLAIFGANIAFEALFVIWLLQPSHHPDWASPAHAQVEQWEAEGRTEDAEQIRKIASQPFPLWGTGDVAAAEAETRDYVGRATDAGQRPMLVAYNIPQRDCGSFSGGGAPNADYYRNWIAALVRGLGDTPATVVLEPDAVPHELSGCVDGALRDERYALLGEAIDALKAAGATVYLDAGNPGFISDVDALAGALDRSGVRQADGFSLNVANFYPTPEIVEFGTRISEKLGGTHFVVDTSRNGRGRPSPEEIGDAPAFCNPPGRGLGANPTTDTGSPIVDALLWIKRPGESDGACRPGELAAGQWYPEYALGLARRAG